MFCYIYCTSSKSLNAVVYEVNSLVILLIAILNTNAQFACFIWSCMTKSTVWKIDGWMGRTRKLSVIRLAIKFYCITQQSLKFPLIHEMKPNILIIILRVILFRQFPFLSGYNNHSTVYKNYVFSIKILYTIKKI